MRQEKLDLLATAIDTLEECINKAPEDTFDYYGIEVPKLMMTLTKDLVQELIEENKKLLDK